MNVNPLIFLFLIVYAEFVYRSTNIYTYQEYYKSKSQNGDDYKFQTPPFKATDM